MLHTLLSSRAVQDLKLVPVVFEALGLKKTRAEVLDLLDRVALIHDSRRPVSPQDLGLDGGDHE